MTSEQSSQNDRPPLNLTRITAGQPYEIRVVLRETSPTTPLTSATLKRALMRALVEVGIGDVTVRFAVEDLVRARTGERLQIDRAGVWRHGRGISTPVALD